MHVVWLPLITITLSHPCSAMVASASAQAIEVLLKNKAFVVKRCASDQGVKGQITWAKVGGIEEAWAMAVERAGFQ